jgi:DNA-binding helix-hairpin-helix protein with protein kinase domain
MPPQIVDANGREIQLTTLLGQGGEGAVYSISSSAELVAKVYPQPLSAERSTKIQLMAAYSNPVVRQFSAWPAGLVFTKNGRAPIGLLMPKVANRKDIHKLYSPKSRRDEFKRVDWRLLTRAGINTAKAFGAVHGTGCIIGDVNEGSVLVADDATVRLIDCDSFQVISNGKHFACEVGVETFTPPELQGKNLREVIRTTNHDNFGLAIMIFLLLFMGRHPFSGRFLGKGDMPIGKAISELRFAYSAMRADVQMDRPPHTPPLSIVGDEVAFLFERAFAKQMVQGGRPEPLDWVKALTALEQNLKQCTVSASHWHHKNTPCPWCPMEATTGVELFPFVVQGGLGVPGIDLTTLWRQIDALSSPGPAPEIQIVPPSPSAQALQVAGSFRRANVIAFSVALALGAIAIFGGLQSPAPLLLLFAALLSFFGARRWFDNSSDIYKFRSAQTAAESTWDQARKQWTERCGSKPFDDKMQEVLRVRQTLDRIPILRTSRLDQLRTQVRQAQLVRFLDKHRIEDAQLDGIGPGRKRTLQSYGIETAADLISPISVPGFGAVLGGTLIAWRQSIERRFVFNPATGVDPRDVEKVEQDILTERRKLEQAARTGHSELSQLRARILTARTQMRGPVEAAYRAHLQATADYKAIGGR